MPPLINNNYRVVPFTDPDAFASAFSDIVCSACQSPSAPYLAKFARIAAWLYGYLNLMPRWLLLLATGTIASTAVNFMHSGEEAKIKAEKEKRLLAQANERREREAKEAAEAQLAETAVDASAKTSAVKKPSTPKKRKGGKK